MDPLLSSATSLTILLDESFSSESLTYNKEKLMTFPNCVHEESVHVVKETAFLDMALAGSFI